MSEIQLAIVELGFEPRIADRPERETRASTASAAAIPEPVASALAEARAEGKLVFVDFYAKWCGPCKVLHAKTFPDARVQSALEGFVFVQVDADVDLEAISHFDVVGMPTLLVLTGDGEELTRYVGGSVSAAELVELLLSARATRREQES